MGVTVDFYLCGVKGAEVLRGICSDPSTRKLVRQVICAAEDIDGNISYDVIRNICKSQSIPFYDRVNHFDESTADYRLVVGWRWIIPHLEKTIVLHDSILPAYRGFSPLVCALIEGENNIGATAFYATDKYDEGPVISQKSITIIHPIRIRQAMAIMAELYVEIVEEIFRYLVKGKIPPAKQQQNGDATYSLWRDSSDYFIDWKEDAEKLLRTIYALSEPYEGARTSYENRTVILREATVVPDVAIVNRTPGKVIMMDDDGPVIVCGSGLLKITDMAFAENGASALPLKKFRSRFG